MGEHKFDGYRFGKNWELENGKKIGVLVIQKVAKTGNIEKKELSLTMREMTQG